ncbi:hypothetical protein [Nostoc commune]|uniref:hypothetical protein n=1 Tax=Nostoc commune TaxID=1178 RepID=UPI0018C47BE9|nr:hypothetical protein [Nostoc commune]MBG1261059.1 hypothetical protein [Nostoc commune BAE]
MSPSLRSLPIASAAIRCGGLDWQLALPDDGGVAASPVSDRLPPRHRPLIPRHYLLYNIW